MNQTRYYVRVGIAVVVALAALIVGVALLRGPLLGGRSVRFPVVFDDARGITEGAEVHMAGVRIGSVERVGLDRSNRARLTLRIDKDRSIPRGSRFTISSSLLGGTPVLKVDPTPGTPGTAIGDNETGLRGDNTGNLDSAFAKSERLLESFQRTASAVEKIATDRRTQENLSATLRNVRVATEDLPRLSRTVELQIRLLSLQSSRLLRQLEVAAAGGNRVVADAGALTGDLRATLNENRGSLRSLIENTSETASAFRGLAESVTETLEGGKLKENLAASTDNLRSITQRLDTITANVERLSGDPRLNADIRETTGNLRETSASIRSLAARIEGIRLPGERRRPAGGDGGTPTPPAPVPSASLLEPGLVVDTNYDTDTERLRLDTNFTLVRPQGRFYRAGLYDVTETNRLNVQVGQSSGPSALRYGLFAGKLGVGFDQRLGPFDLRLDVFDPNRLTVNARARVGVSGNASALFGIDSLGHGNRAVLGVQFRR